MKKIFILAGLVVMCTTVSAQTNKKNNLNRELEVTREYEPNVKGATKIDVKPNMVDTVKLRPEFNYNITTEHAYNRNRLSIKPIGVADVNIVTTRRQLEKLNAEAGFAVPFKTMADINYSLYDASTSQVNVNLKHDGLWTKIENDANIKTPATQTRNNISLFANKNWDKANVSGSVYGLWDKYTRYGYYNFGQAIPESFDSRKSALAQRFTGGGLEFALNGFGKLLNTSLLIETAYVTDKYDGGRADLNAELGVGRNFKNGNNLNVVLAALMAKGKNQNRTDISSYSVKPMYTMNVNGMSLGLGFDAAITKSGYLKSESQVCFFPKFNLEINLKNSALFFVNLDGGIYIDPYMANPYMISSVETPMSKNYELKAGIVGNIGQLKYTIGAGYDIMNDAPMYVNVYNAKFLGNVFDYQTDDINIIKAFVNLNAKVSDRVALMAGVLFRSADSDKFADALYVPMIESSIAVKYSSEKFNTQVKCDFVGEQYFCDQIATSPEILNQIVKADGYADLKFECNYKFNKQITFGVMVDNILNSNIYKFNHYRQLGTSVMAKVNLKF